MRLLLLVVFTLPLWSDVPRTLDYQGVLTDAEGSAVPDGLYEIMFRMYSTPTGGSPLWEEKNTVEVNKGIFNAVLGTVTKLDLDFDEPYWVGISVEGEAELAPHISLTASAYSLNSCAVRGDNLIPGIGAVGIDTTAPAEKLDVDGGVKIGNITNSNPGTIRWTGTDLYRLKFGMATQGIYTGLAHIRVVEGLEMLRLGAGSSDVVTIKNNGDVFIGSNEQTGRLRIYREGVSNPFIEASTTGDGGTVNLYDENHNTAGALRANTQGTGGYFFIARDETNPGFLVDGNHLEARRAASEASNTARIERELASMRAEINALREEMKKD